MAREVSCRFLRWLLMLSIASSACACTASSATAGALSAERPPAPPATTWPAVVPGRQLTFPADFGAHPDYRLEWWYLTGRVDDGRQTRGFQITFFRLRPQWQESLATPFAARQLMFAHAALADPAFGRLRHAERRARAGFGNAAAIGDTDVRLGSWRLWREDRDGRDAYRIAVTASDFAFDLTATAAGAPVEHGDAGYSRKGPQPSQASYYYSRPQLAVAGRLTVAGRERAVTGRAWLDHEWSSAMMASDAVGWDWLGANLDDGGALMLFRMRDAQGATVWAGGTRWRPGGPPRTFQPGQIAFRPQRTWRSPRTGIAYPIAHQVAAADEVFDVRPVFDDQELDARASVGAIYWEGAVDLLQGGRPVGRGYLELTGYGERLRW